MRGGHVVQSLLARSLYGTVPGHLGLSQLADKDRGGDDAGRSADWLLQPPGDGGAHRRVPDTPGVSPHPQLGPDSSLLAGAVCGARHRGRRLGLRSVRKFTQENVTFKQKTRVRLMRFNENYTIVLLLKWGYFLLEKDAEQYKGNFIKYGAIN